MTNEEQLLNRIFDDSTSTSEREAAIAALKRITGKDRAGLVEKYTRSSPWVVTRSDVTAAIENITLKMEVSTLKSGRSMAESDLLRLVFSLCGQDRDLYDEVHRNTGLIAATGAKMPDLLKGLRYLIDSGVSRRPAYEPPLPSQGASRTKTRASDGSETEERQARSLRPPDFTRNRLNESRMSAQDTALNSCRRQRCRNFLTVIPSGVPATGSSSRRPVRNVVASCT
jgi:hypothetical protein